MLRQFILVRHKDVTGTSGTGVVAEGVVFEDGGCNIPAGGVVAMRRDQRAFRDSGSLSPTSKTWANAQSYVSQNTAGLSAKGVPAYVTGIQVSGSDNMVRVSVSANLSILFPSVVPNVTVTQIGVAKLRALTH